MKKIKGMKKSMFFTTVLMVVLLVVALSTATFAWFSANNTVVATPTTMTAATSSSADIAIGWSSDTLGSSITFKTLTGMAPSMPKNKLLKVGDTTAAQYIVTATAIGASFQQEMSYGGDTGVKEINVVDTELGLVVSGADGDANALKQKITVPDTQTKAVVGTPAPFSRVYRTKKYSKAGYIAINGSLTSDEFTKIAVSTEEYDYLTIVDSSAQEGGQITVEDAKKDPYNISETDAIAGNKIYNRNEVPETFTVVGKDEAAPAGAMAWTEADGIAVDGVKDAPYVVLMTVKGKIDAKVGSGPAVYYIHTTDAEGAPYNCIGAKAGDKLYCVEQSAVAATTASTDGAFELISAHIDADNRFKTGEQDVANGQMTENKESGAKTFYVRNRGNKAAKISINMTIVGFDADTATDKMDPDFIRIAVFAKAPGDSKFLYRGTLTNGGTQVYYGKIFQGAPAMDTNLNVFAGSAALTDFLTLGAGSNVELKFYAWYDGTRLNTENSGKSLDVSFNFVGNPV